MQGDQPLTQRFCRKAVQVILKGSHNLTGILSAPEHVPITAELYLSRMPAEQKAQRRRGIRLCIKGTQAVDGGQTG
jgi:small nuclear ribonucleoprotein (snRNP)-like protein